MVELSSLDVRFLAHELQTLEDAILDKIFEPSPGTFLFRTRHPARGRSALLVCPGSYAALVADPPESPQAPSPFAALLRKHLVGVRIRRVDQHAFDRILVFHVDQRGEALRMVVELFGKGNLVLVDADGATRLAQRTETFRDRTVKRGAAYAFPPARVNPLELGREDFEEQARRTEKDGVRFLATDLALGPDLAEELVHRAGLDKTKPAKAWTAPQRAAVWSAWSAFTHAPADPHVADDGVRVRVESVAFQAPKFAAYERRRVETLSAAIEAALGTEAGRAPPPRDEERERLQRQIAHQEKARTELETEAAAWERRGQGVYEAYAQWQAALASAQEAVRTRGWPGLEGDAKRSALPAPLVGVDAAVKRVRLRVGEETVAVDPEASLEKLASEFFDEAKRIREKIASAGTAIADARARLEATPEPSAAPAVKARAPAKRFWFEAYRWCYTSQGLLVVGGRDAGSNEKLVKKHLSTGDLYFHADIHGAPSCVLKAGEAAPSAASLEEAAHFAAAYSKAFVQFGSADAYWVRPEQVSKTAPTGESVARGAFVIRGERTYIPRRPMEVAVGLVELDKNGRPGPSGVVKRVMGGSPPSLRQWAESVFVVTRGDTPPADAVRSVAQALGVTLDEVQAVLPPGPLRVAPLKEVRS